MTDPPICPPADLTLDGPYAIIYRKPGDELTSVALVEPVDLAKWEHAPAPEGTIRVKVVEIVSTGYALTYHGSTTTTGGTLLVAATDLLEATDELLAWGEARRSEASRSLRVAAALREGIGSAPYSRDSVLLSLTLEQAEALAERLDIDVPVVE